MSTIYQRIEELMKDKGDVIGIIHAAILSGITSLTFSEYVSNIKQRTIPTAKILVPALSQVENFLFPMGPNMRYLATHLMDELVQHPAISPLLDMDQFKPFRNGIDKFKELSVVEVVVQNASRDIVQKVDDQFGVTDPNNQDVVGSNDVDAFGQIVARTALDYILEQVVYRIIIHLSGRSGHHNIFEIYNVDGHTDIVWPEDSGLIIRHDIALADIYLTRRVLEIPYIGNMIRFVTSTYSVGTNEDGVELVNTGLTNSVLRFTIKDPTATVK